MRSDGLGDAGRASRTAPPAGNSRAGFPHGVAHERNDGAELPGLESAGVRVAALEGTHAASAFRARLSPRSSRSMRQP